MSYTEMIGLDDSTLEQRQVTKGARKKIIQSIAKLRERVSNLKQLEKVRQICIFIKLKNSTKLWISHKKILRTKILILF